MKKYSFLILIAIVSVFASCSKEENNGQDEMMPSKSFTYTDTLEIFSDDNLSSVTVAISSNDLGSFEETKKTLILLTDLNNISTPTELKETRTSQGNDILDSKVEVDILKVNTKLKVIGIGKRDDGLKYSYPSANTFIYTCYESEWFMHVRFDYDSSSSTGIKIYFGHKDSWLEAWNYSSGFVWCYHSSHNGFTYSNPSNGYDPVWKLGAKVVTDLPELQNYTIILTVDGDY